MLSIDDAVEVDNPAEVLRNQDGEFDVVSPYGHTFRVVCRRGLKMTVHEINQPGRPVSSPGIIWRIRRIRSL
jgi:hypothetical protein